MSRTKNFNTLKDKYISLSVFSNDKTMTNKDRQLILRNFFLEVYDCTYGDSKLGVLLKFNNSLGYKDLCYQPNRGGDGYIYNKIETSDDYLSPYSLLVHHMYWLNKEDEIVTFIVPLKEMKDENYSEYNYNTLDILIRFQSFLNKVYGNNIRVELNFKSDIKLSLKEKVLSYFYVITAEGEHYDCEMSLHRKLKLKEKRYILDVMKEYTTYKPAILQYYCDTCNKHDPNYPYHVELDRYNFLVETYNEFIKCGQGDKIPASFLEALEDCK